MIKRRDLLIEIGTEELPPKSLKRLAESFAQNLRAGLESHALPHQDCQWYATPRRLAVIVRKLAGAQQDQQVEKRGPALAAAFDPQGNPTKAAEGFARSCNTSVDSLEKLESAKGSWLVHRSVEKGKDTAELVPGIINDALDKLPIPKRMRWADRTAEFVRPVHWSVVLFGNETIPCDILETRSGNVTHGHRFHNPKPIRLRSSREYLAKLKDKGRVIADFAERRQSIEAMVIEAAGKHHGRALIDADLLDEVTSLVEWPVAITGSFEEKFLELPAEVLIATMQDHQKYFPVTNTGGDKLLNRFVTIANIESNAPDEIRKGNERVIRPRLTDAAFFWRRDCSRPLHEYGDKLQDVVFQKQLGTLAEKTLRVQNLSLYIADMLGYDKVSARRAAELAKCDLFTEMVGEFPELQGVMGRYYALASGESQEVALALDEQYMPRYAGDDLPATATGRVLAVADKIDTITGIFGIGQIPTGDKDPYALRRAALGCLRILIECELEIDLNDCLMMASRSLDKTLHTSNAVPAIFDFMMERLRNYYLEQEIPSDVFDAVLARKPPAPYDFHQRILAVVEFKKLKESENLASANKRILNILRQAGNGDPDIITAVPPDGSLLTEPSEIELMKQLVDVDSKVSILIPQARYEEALHHLAGLKDNIDAFFDQVMVMVNDANLRTARLQMLAHIRHLFHQIADISLLHHSN